MFSVSRSFWERNWSFLFINKPLGRWKSKPNMAAMKKLKDFCDIHGIDFTALEEQWNNLGKDN